MQNETKLFGGFYFLSIDENLLEIQFNELLIFRIEKFHFLYHNFSIKIKGTEVPERGEI